MWRVSGDSVVRENHEVVCTVHINYGKQPHLDLALIAAAPKLLSALEYIVANGLADEHKSSLIELVARAKGLS